MLNREEAGYPSGLFHRENTEEKMLYGGFSFPRSLYSSRLIGCGTEAGKIMPLLQTWNPDLHKSEFKRERN